MRGSVEGHHVHLDLAARSMVSACWMAAPTAYTSAVVSTCSGWAARSPHFLDDGVAILASAIDVVSSC